MGRKNLESKTKPQIAGFHNVADEANASRDLSETAPKRLPTSAEVIAALKHQGYRGVDFNYVDQAKTRIVVTATYIPKGKPHYAGGTGTGF